MTKNLERKKKGQTQGRTNRRMPICNPTIQLVVVDLYTKYEVSILNGCGDIFDEKVLRNYGRTDGRKDGRTDGTTDRCKPVYPPLFQSGGINTFLSILQRKHHPDLQTLMTFPDLMLRSAWHNLGNDHFLGRRKSGKHFYHSEN